ncbi:alpha/beta-hydrolase [Hypoxylon sp. NC1633]|nr:alpha/beta-hydrolase [Hypoxylon sp. NC1633]
MKFGLLLASLLGFKGGPIGMDDALTTANMPAQFLADVYFLEHVPLMALQVDPRISYALYVPTSHYNPDPNNTSSIPSVGKLPLLVYIHGTGRNTVAIYDELVPFANSTPCAILAPVFPSGIEGPNDLDSYKELSTASLRSDLALLSVIDQVAYRWPGIETTKVFMMGFSGGGQFAQRFMYLYPERLAAISVGSPGRPTYLDDSQDWPIGTANVEAVFNKTIRTDLLGAVPIQLVVGNKDIELHGDEDFWKWQQETFGSGGLPPMNETRLELMQRLHDSLEQAGIETQLDIVDGVAHNETGVRQTVLKFLQPWIQKGI